MKALGVTFIRKAIYGALGFGAATVAASVSHAIQGPWLMGTVTALGTGLVALLTRAATWSDYKGNQP